MKPDYLVIFFILLTVLVVSSDAKSKPKTRSKEVAKSKLIWRTKSSKPVAKSKSGKPKSKLAKPVEKLEENESDVESKGTKSVEKSNEIESVVKSKGAKSKLSKPVGKSKVSKAIGKSKRTKPFDKLEKIESDVESKETKSVEKLNEIESVVKSKGTKSKLSKTVGKSKISKPVGKSKISKAIGKSKRTKPVDKLEKIESDVESKETKSVEKSTEIESVVKSKGAKSKLSKPVGKSKVSKGIGKSKKAKPVDKLEELVVNQAKESIKPLGKSKVSKRRKSKWLLKEELAVKSESTNQTEKSKDTAPIDNLKATKPVEKVELKQTNHVEEPVVRLKEEKLAAKSKPTEKSKPIKPYMRSNNLIVKNRRLVPENSLRTNVTESMLLPSLASITYIKIHICSGSIIANTVVLTVAHCIFDGLSMPLPKENMLVVVGINDESDGVAYRVRGYITHESFSNLSYANDIALLSTVKPIIMSLAVGKVLLRPMEIFDQVMVEYATTSWYGTPRYDNSSLEETFNVVNVHSIPINLCRKIFVGVSIRHICMTSVGTHGDCNEDSGGPLVIGTKNKLEQVGILSFKINCGDNKPEVYTRISWYYDWIKRAIKRML